MATSLLGRLSFDNRRAIANAGRETARRRSEDELVEALVRAVARRDVERTRRSAEPVRLTRLQKTA